MICNYCHQEKTESELAKGKRAKCKACHAKYARAFKARNPEKVKAARKRYSESGAATKTHRAWKARNHEHSQEYMRKYNREYVRKNKRQIMLKTAKWRAEKAGVPCTITIEDIVIPELCPVLGIPLQIGTRGFTNNSPTLDRIRPELGYVPGNVAVISLRANRIKNDAGLVELEAVANWLREQLKRQGNLPGSPAGVESLSLRSETRPAVV